MKMPTTLRRVGQVAKLLILLHSFSIASGLTCRACDDDPKCSSGDCDGDLCFAGKLWDFDGINSKGCIRGQLPTTQPPNTCVDDFCICDKKNCNDGKLEFPPPEPEMEDDEPSAPERLKCYRSRMAEDDTPSEDNTCDGRLCFLADIQLPDGGVEKIRGCSDLYLGIEGHALYCVSPPVTNLPLTVPLNDIDEGGSICYCSEPMCNGAKPLPKQEEAPVLMDIKVKYGLPSGLKVEGVGGIRVWGTEALPPESGSFDIEGAKFLQSVSLTLTKEGEVKRKEQLAKTTEPPPTTEAPPVETTEEEYPEGAGEKPAEGEEVAPTPASQKGSDKDEEEEESESASSNNTTIIIVFVVIIIIIVVAGLVWKFQIASKIKAARYQSVS